MWIVAEGVVGPASGRIGRNVSILNFPKIILWQRLVRFIASQDRGEVLDMQWGARGDLSSLYALSGGTINAKSKVRIDQSSVHTEGSRVSIHTRSGLEWTCCVLINGVGKRLRRVDIALEGIGAATVASSGIVGRQDGVVCCFLVKRGLCLDRLPAVDPPISTVRGLDQAIVADGFRCLRLEDRQDAKDRHVDDRQ